MYRVLVYAARFVASSWFFYTILLLFVVQALQLAVTSALPMAFDEGYHFQVIQFFSGHVQPFIGSQPPETYDQGAIIHNPSFLYHYVLSFPYRAVAALTDSTAVQVLVLRVCNIALAVGALYALRQLFRRLCVSPLIINIVLCLVVLTPMLSALAAQINYDNAVMLAAALIVLYAVRLVNEARLHTGTLLGLASLTLLGCLVKFSLLPMLLAVGALVMFVVVRQWRHYGGRSLFISLRNSFWRLRRVQQVALVSVFAVAVGLWLGFYGYALVRYHSPVPQCDQILSVEACRNYYAWNRNYEASLQADAGSQMNAVSYTLEWGKAMYYHLFAELIPQGGIVAVARPYYAVVMLLTAVAGACLAWQARQLLRRYPGLWVVVGILATYLFFLWTRNYSEYVRLGEWVAVQGRYLMPIVGAIYLLLVLGLASWLQARMRVGWWLGAGVFVALLAAGLVYGGNVQYVRHITPVHAWDTAVYGRDMLASGSGLSYPMPMTAPYFGIAVTAGVVSGVFLVRVLQRADSFEYLDAAPKLAPSAKPDDV